MMFDAEVGSINCLQLYGDLEAMKALRLWHIHVIMFSVGGIIDLLRELCTWYSNPDETSIFRCWHLLSKKTIDNTVCGSSCNL